MKSNLGFLVAILGLTFSVTNCCAVVKTLMDGVSASRGGMHLPGADPAQLSAVIGETIIAIASYGFLAFVPAGLLYAALMGFRVRQAWFYSCTRLAAVYFLFVPPFATVYGIILLITLRRRKLEFAPVQTDS